MQCIVLMMHVKPGHEDLFEENFRKMQAWVYENEPGNMLYQLTRDPKDPLNYILIHIYESREALKFHVAAMTKLAEQDPDQADHTSGPPTAHMMPVVGRPVHRGAE